MTLPTSMIHQRPEESLHASTKNTVDSSSNFGAATLIRASSLLRVLDGVAVAVKVPDAYIHTLALSIQRCVTVEKSDSPISNGVIDSKIDFESASSFNSWRGKLASYDENRREGLRQLAGVTLAIALLRELSRQGSDMPPETLDAIWSMIHDAITSATGTELQFTASRSAQGFLAVPLCSLVRNGRIEELFRFHVWLPDGERGQSAVAVHSHQPFAQSWILAGTGIDRSFDVQRVDDYSLATHTEYALCWTDNKQTGKDYKTHQLNSTVTNTGKLLSVKAGRTETHTRDMSYTVPSGAFHYTDVAGDELHATLFFFDAHRGFVPDAGVTGPKDGTSYTQVRDPQGMTAQILAQKAYKARRQEQTNGASLQNASNASG